MADPGNHPQSPDLQGLRRWTLATRDAHRLYKQFGWDALSNPESWMEIFRPFHGEGRRLSRHLINGKDHIDERTIMTHYKC
ncbi:MAG: hypothetical protein U0X87_03910 [Anaerolineales bacterium]